MTSPATSPDSERVLIAAFEGWSDAGSATTTALQHLGTLQQAELLHSIGADGFVDFQVHRPKVSFDDNGKRVLEWPETRLYGTVHRPGAEPNPQRETIRRIDGTPVTDLFLLAGVEPARDWSMFADELVDLADMWEIDTVILLGSMYSDSPHSRPIVTTLSSDNGGLRARTGAGRSDYEGPVGISTVLDLALSEAGIAALSLWAQVPHYVHSAPSPKATLAILDKLEELLDVVIPRGNLLAEATEWEANIDRIAATDDDMASYIRTLEAARDAATAPETTGEAIAHEFEKYLGLDPNTFGGEHPAPEESQQPGTDEGGLDGLGPGDDPEASK